MKIILKLLSSLILFLLILISPFLYCFKTPTFLLKNLEQQNYSQKIYQKILDEMQNNIMPSGFDETILENLFTKEQVKIDLEQFIYNLYNEKEVEIDTIKIENQLRDNIHKYLEYNDLEIENNDSLETFIYQISSIYHEEISIYNYLPIIIKTMLQLLEIGKKLFFLGLLLLTSCFILLFFLKERSLASIPYTSAILLYLFSFFIQNHIDIPNLLIFGVAFSSVVITLLFNYLQFLQLCSIYLFILGSILCLKNPKISRSN